MEQKTVEQIAEEHAMNHSDSSQHETAKYSFIDGFNHAQQSQPMWREIEDGEDYEQCLVKSDEKRIRFIDWCAGGNYLLYIGYTHYLASEDLLKLPTHTKTTPQERG